MFISGFRTKEEKEVSQEREKRPRVSEKFSHSQTKNTTSPEQHTPMLKVEFFDEEDQQQGLSHGIRDSTCFNCFSSVTRSQIVRLTLARFIEYFEKRKKFALSSQGLKDRGARGSVFSQPETV